MKVHIYSCADCEKCGISLSNWIYEESDITITNNPKKCDLLIIIGCLLKDQEQKLIDTWNRATKAKILLFGDCPTGKSEFFSHYFNDIKNLAISEKKIDGLIPIDYKIMGCPPNYEDYKEYYDNYLKNIM
ncbi:MAG: hypothetical protein ACFFBP_11645 [Promethearchaeota archaeon]